MNVDKLEDLKPIILDLAPKLGICSSIVVLVSSGRTLIVFNLVVSEVLFKISSKLVVIKIAFKLNNDKVSQVIIQLKKAISG